MWGDGMPKKVKVTGKGKKKKYSASGTALGSL